MSAYELLSQEAYWADGQPLPQVGMVDGFLDNRSAAFGGVRRTIEAEYDALRLDATEKRTLLVVEGEELPMASQGLVRVVLDERRVRTTEPEWLIDSGAQDEFDRTAAYMDDLKWYAGHSASATVYNEDGGYSDITRSVLYARAGASGKQLIGVRSSSADIVEKERWGKYPTPEKRVVIPALTVGTTYRAEKTDTDLRVAHATLVTPMHRNESKGDRPRGQRSATLGWLLHQAGLAAGRA